jgi:hypothetical protein
LRRMRAKVGPVTLSSPTMMSEPPPSVDPVANAWAEVEANWADDGVHKRFIALCAAVGQLSAAGQRYRTVRETDASRSVDARRWQDAVIGQAIATMNLRRTERPNRQRRLVWVGYGLSLFFMLYALLSILRAPRP